MATGKATRQKFPMAQFNEPRPFLVAGSFELDGAATDPINARGRGFVVTRSGSGEYTVTFPDKYPQLVACTATMEGTAEVDAYVEVDSYTVSTGALVLRVMDAALNSAIDTLDGPRVNFHVTLQLNKAIRKTWT